MYRTYSYKPILSLITVHLKMEEQYNLNAFVWIANANWVERTSSPKTKLLSLEALLAGQTVLSPTTGQLFMLTTMLHMVHPLHLIQIGRMYSFLKSIIKMRPSNIIKVYSNSFQSLWQDVHLTSWSMYSIMTTTSIQIRMMFQLLHWIIIMRM